MSLLIVGIGDMLLHQFNDPINKNSQFSVDMAVNTSSGTRTDKARALKSAGLYHGSGICRYQMVGETMDFIFHIR